MTHTTESTVRLSGPHGARYEIPAGVLEAARIPDEEVPALRAQIGVEAPADDVAAYALDWETLAHYRVVSVDDAAAAEAADDTAGFAWRGGYFLIERIITPGPGGGSEGALVQGHILIAPWRTHVGDGIPTKAERSVRPGVRENLYG